MTTAITDMGAITPILYQGAIPVFADVDARTGNLTAEAIERCLSDRTRAIVVTHLFGNPADMTAIMALADARGIPVVFAETWNDTITGDKQKYIFRIAPLSSWTSILVRRRGSMSGNS